MCRTRRAAGGLTLALGWLALASASPAIAGDDPQRGQQWNLDQIGATAAWEKSTGAGITIGIVDSGVDASHPDLAGKIDAMATCLRGTCREGSAPDGDGHGTAVSGIAAAATGNGSGIAGVAPDARLVVAKALDEDGTGYTEDINNAIQWVVDHGARVVNLSLGDPDLVVTSRVGTPMKAAIEYAWSRGAIPVLASGNYERGVTGGSANYGSLDAVVVGATDRDGNITSYSTSLGNAKWGLVAPGGNGDGRGQDVPAPLPGGRYAWLAGTSMAAPHVSGALAVLLAQGLSPKAAVERLLATVDTSVGCGEGCKGRLNLESAATSNSAVEAQGVVPPSDASAADLPPAVVALAVMLAALAAAGSVGAWWWLREP
ncbi:MAG: S8 family serine peptidase [Acidimicrobiales bacterium]